MSAIFISYCRDPDREAAGRLRDNLAERFGEDEVFLDESSIGSEEWANRIRAELQRCRLMICVVSVKWKERLKSPIKRRDDWVVEEIKTAIGRDVPIMPILINGNKIDEGQIKALAPFARKIFKVQAQSLNSGAMRKHEVTRLAGDITKRIPNLKILASPAEYQTQLSHLVHQNLNDLLPLAKQGDLDALKRVAAHTDGPNFQSMLPADQIRALSAKADVLIAESKLVEAELVASALSEMACPEVAQILVARIAVERSEFGKVLELAPSTKFRVTYLRAIALINLGRLQDALKELDLCESNPLVPAMRAIVYLLQNKRLLAKEEIDAALAMAEPTPQILEIELTVLFWQGVSDVLVPKNILLPPVLNFASYTNSIEAKLRFSVVLNRCEALIINKRHASEKWRMQLWKAACLYASGAGKDAVENYVSQTLMEIPGQALLVTFALSIGLNFDTASAEKALRKALDQSETTTYVLLAAMQLKLRLGHNSGAAQLIEQFAPKLQSQRERDEVLAIRESILEDTNQEQSDDSPHQLIAAKQWDQLCVVLKSSGAQATSAIDLWFIAAEEMALNGAWTQLWDISTELLIFKTGTATRWAIYAAARTNRPLDVLRLINESRSQFSEARLTEIARLEMDAQYKLGRLDLAQNLGAEILRLSNSPSDQIRLLAIHREMGDSAGTQVIARQLNPEAISPDQSLRVTEAVLQTNPTLARKFLARAVNAGLDTHSLLHGLSMAIRLGDDHLQELFEEKMHGVSDADKNWVRLGGDDLMQWLDENHQSQIQRVALWARCAIPIHAVYQNPNDLLGFWHGKFDPNGSIEIKSAPWYLHFGARSKAPSSPLNAGNLCMDTTALLSAHYLGVLDLIESHYAPITVSACVMQVLVQAENFPLAQILSERINSGIALKTYQFITLVPRAGTEIPDEKTPLILRAALQLTSSEVPSGTWIWVDDRAFHGQQSSAFTAVNSVDIVDELARAGNISQEKRLALRWRMRELNACFIPVCDEEIFAALRSPRAMNLLRFEQSEFARRFAQLCHSDNESSSEKIYTYSLFHAPVQLIQTIWADEGVEANLAWSNASLIWNELTQTWRTLDSPQGGENLSKNLGNVDIVFLAFAGWMLAWRDLTRLENYFKWLDQIVLSQLLRVDRSAMNSAAAMLTTLLAKFVVDSKRLNYEADFRARVLVWVRLLPTVLRKALQANPAFCEIYPADERVIVEIGDKQFLLGDAVQAVATAYQHGSSALKTRSKAPVAVQIEISGSPPRPFAQFSDERIELDGRYIAFSPRIEERTRLLRENTWCWEGSFQHLSDALSTLDAELDLSKKLLLFDDWMSKSPSAAIKDYCDAAKAGGDRPFFKPSVYFLCLLGIDPGQIGTVDWEVAAQLVLERVDVYEAARRFTALPITMPKVLAEKLFHAPEFHSFIAELLHSSSPWHRVHGLRLVRQREPDDSLHGVAQKCVDDWLEHGFAQAEAFFAITQYAKFELIEQLDKTRLQICVQCYAGMLLHPVDGKILWDDAAKMFSAMDQMPLAAFLRGQINARELRDFSHFSARRLWACVAESMLDEFKAEIPEQIAAQLRLELVSNGNPKPALWLRDMHFPNMLAGVEPPLERLSALLQTPVLKDLSDADGVSQVFTAALRDSMALGTDFVWEIIASILPFSDIPEHDFKTLFAYLQSTDAAANSEVEARSKVAVLAWLSCHPEVDNSRKQWAIARCADVIQRAEQKQSLIFDFCVRLAAGHGTNIGTIKIAEFLKALLLMQPDVATNVDACADPMIRNLPDADGVPLRECIVLARAQMRINLLSNNDAAH